MTGLFKAGIEWVKEKTNPVPVIEETRGKGDNPSGDSAQIGSSGDSAKIESTGEDSVVCCAGDNSIAKASIGSWITLAEWKYSDAKKRDMCPFASRPSMLTESTSKRIHGTDLLMENLKRRNNQ